MHFLSCDVQTVSSCEKTRLHHKPKLLSKYYKKQKGFLFKSVNLSKVLKKQDRRFMLGLSSSCVSACLTLTEWMGAFNVSPAWIWPRLQNPAGEM